MYHYSSICAGVSSKSIPMASEQVASTSATASEASFTTGNTALQSTATRPATTPSQGVASAVAPGEVPRTFGES